MRFETMVEDIQQLTPSVKHFVIKRPSSFRFLAGQFVAVIMNVNGEELRRSYSIASKINEKKLALCIKILKDGRATPLIDQWKIGEKITLIGPLGHFVLHANAVQRNNVFVATGTGITPFRPMIRQLLENECNGRVLLIVGYKNEEEALYDDEFTALTKQYKNFSYYKVLSKSEKQEQLHVQDIIQRAFLVDADYYICGLKDMVLSVRDLLFAKGIEREHVFFERYD